MSAFQTRVLGRYENILRAGLLYMDKYKITAGPQEGDDLNAGLGWAGLGWAGLGWAGKMKTGTYPSGART